MCKNYTLAGIYIHIPFCKQACHYCDFHFSTQLKNKPLMLDAVKKEIKIQQYFLKGEKVTSIYFGGGTPSLLDGLEIEHLLSEINSYYQISDNIEITLEANPDDLNKSKLKAFAKAGINRLSIGIQSFHNPHLEFMNRAHNADEAFNCIALAKSAGFENLTIDLIYGIPYLDHTLWRKDIEIALQLGINHISAYCLTIEPDTVFGNWLNKSRIKPIEEEYAAEQFEILCEILGENNFHQYEISNFCKDNHYSRHNSAYWKQEKYLGVGPSAHSFDGKNRQFNVANNQKYVKSINTGKVPFTFEKLSPTQVVNEYLLTTLRTIWGSQISVLEEKFPGWLTKFDSQLTELKTSDLLSLEDDTIFLTQKGKLVADEITLKLFVED